VLYVKHAKKNGPWSLQDLRNVSNYIASDGLSEANHFGTRHSSAHPLLSDDSFLLEALSLVDSSPGKASNRKMNLDEISMSLT